MSDQESSRLLHRTPFAQFAGPLDSPPPTGCIAVEFGACSRQGSRQAVNTDHYLVLRLERNQEAILTSFVPQEVPERFEESAYGMVIADGIGPAGEVASRLAITTLVEMFVHLGRWNVRISEPIAEEMIDRGTRFYRGADSTLLQAGRTSPTGLQTTMTLVYMAGHNLFFAHVGHSRAYLFRDGELMRLTRDHTAVARPGKAAIVDVAASCGDLEHVLTDLLGMTGPVGPRVDIERCGLLEGDLVLLCTNGLTDMVDDGDIADELAKSRSLNESCRALVNLSLQAGGTDDATVVLARYGMPARNTLAAGPPTPVS